MTKVPFNLFAALALAGCAITSQEKDCLHSSLDDASASTIPQRLDSEPAEDSAPTRQTHSLFFQEQMTGYEWARNGARAYFRVGVSNIAPRPLYVEATLPSPVDGHVEAIRKVVANGDGTIAFESGGASVSFRGPLYADWQADQYYAFRVQAFSDASYSNVIDTFEQPSLCTWPPENVMIQLPENPTGVP